MTKEQEPLAYTAVPMFEGEECPNHHHGCPHGHHHPPPPPFHGRPCRRRKFILIKLLLTIIAIGVSLNLLLCLHHHNAHHAMMRGHYGDSASFRHDDHGWNHHHGHHWGPEHHHPRGEIEPLFPPPMKGKKSHFWKSSFDSSSSDSSSSDSKDFAPDFPGVPDEGLNMVLMFGYHEISVSNMMDMEDNTVASSSVESTPAFNDEKGELIVEPVEVFASPEDDDEDENEAADDYYWN
jgi:hypothetical protein